MVLLCLATKARNLWKTNVQSYVAVLKMYEV